MESIHQTASRPWISHHYNIRRFRDEWQESLDVTMKDRSHFKKTLNAEEFLKLEEECGLSPLRSSDLPALEISEELEIPEDLKLETIKYQKEDLDKRKADSKYEAFVYNYSRCNNFPVHQENAIGQQAADSFIPIKEPEVILTVQVFRPEKKYNNNVKYNPTFHVDQEFMVLGCQYLTELRDKIDCVSDRAIPGDFSENPNAPITITCKDLYKSGFFYIDGKFYNDMRDRNCRDYSEPIMNWAKTSQRGIGPFRKLKMEFTKFIDLELQLGYPYVYVHQGNCEHFLVFSDLVMFGPHHKKNKNEYPLYRIMKPKKRIFCMICRIHTAEWIVDHCKRLPETPFYFCKTCFFGFNYDENNKKIGDFRAYHHVDRSFLM